MSSVAWCEESGSLELRKQEEDICTPVIQLSESERDIDLGDYGMAQPANQVTNYERERVVKLLCRVCIAVLERKCKWRIQNNARNPCRDPSRVEM